MKLILFLIGVFLLSGCAESPQTIVKSTGGQVAIQELPKELAYIELALARMVQFDADANKDGVEVTILPQSPDGSIVKINGTMEFTFYQKVVTTGGSTGLIELQNWSNIKIFDKDFGSYGVKLVLEFNNETEETVALTDFFIGELAGELKVNGKTFEARTGVL